MSEHAFDDMDMGYFLPEDSQLLLTQVRDHARFLARLARPRVADEKQEQAPEVHMGELMFCLDQLAERLDLVLQEVSWPAWRTTAQEVNEVPQEVVAGTEGAGADDSTQADAHGFIHGVTLDQIDRLNLLISGIKAYGDAVFADGMADFAEGTLSMLGYTIFDRANDVDEILGEISAQQLEHGARLRFSVKETPPAYLAQAPCEVGRAPRAMPALAYLLQAYSPCTAGLHLH